MKSQDEDEGERNMALEDVPRCQHVKVNGVQCGSPAMRRRRRCYFHDRMLDGRKQFAAESCIKPRPMFSMCLLEDANSVQVALMQVLNLLGSGQMDPKTAGGGNAGTDGTVTIVFSRCGKTIILQ